MPKGGEGGNSINVKDDSSLCNEAFNTFDNRKTVGIEKRDVIKLLILIFKTIS